MAENKRIRRTPEGHHSEAKKQQRAEAVHKHGMYILAHYGESALTPGGRSRLQELQALFRTEPGRREYREQLAAFMALMVELGESFIREKVEAGETDIFTTSPVSRLPTYINGLIKLLDNWPKDNEPQDITTILQGEARDVNHGEN